jgi:hypothetical protein
LLDATGPEDPYVLDPDRDGVACNGASTESPGNSASDPDAPTIVAATSIHPYAAHVIGGGTPFGAHTFLLVSQGQAGAATGQGGQVTAAQSVDETDSVRQRHRNKARNGKKARSERQRVEHARNK